MFSQIIRPAVVLLVVMSALTGLVYPLAITGIAQVVFPRQANGSLIAINGRVVGSELIGQPFDDPKYFWSRPSATGPMPYNAAASSGANLGPIEPKLQETLAARIKALKDAEPGNERPIPVDLVTASASGLDPQISPAAAEYQLSRVAKARGMDEQALRELVSKHSHRRTFGLLGEDRVDVLALNLELDGLTP